jgi:putative methyltransferase
MQSMNRAVGSRESDRDWRRWHRQYDDPDSPLTKRLAVVQRLITLSLDEAPSGPLSVISICAGEGRDIVGALRRHPRRAEVSGRLVELDAHNATIARREAMASGLGRLEVVQADAGRTDAYAGSVPADLVLCCGVFGNIPDADIHATVAGLPMLCRPGAVVIWTRSRRPPDLTPTVREWFVEAGFEEMDFVAPADELFSVGRHRWSGEVVELVIGRRLFTFG